VLDNISQLKAIDAEWLEEVVRQLSSAEVDIESMWREPYPEYGSAGLKVTTLLNPTGEQENFDYRDCPAPQVTPLLAKLPAIAKFYEESGFKIMGSRLLRLDPGTFLHEHRDFVYLEQVQRYRLHVPLITNQNAFIVGPGFKVHFERGHMWKLDPKSTVHSACNFGDKPRVHLMLDCYVNEPLSKLVATQSIDQKLVHKLPAFNALIEQELLSEARQILEESKNGRADLVTAAEEVLLKAFCQYDLRAQSDKLTTYDLIFKLYEAPEYAERKAYWQERLLEVYPSEAKAPAQLAAV
jgi:hypothetical protein